MRSDEGLPFLLRNGGTPEKHLIETMPGGVAVFDYDGDGDLDVFCANGARQPQLVKVDESYWNRLYRNEGSGRFSDVTAAAGLQGEGYSMGAAVGDFDNDGHPDLFVPSVNRNRLYRNRGDGTFADVTPAEWLGGKQEWSVAGGWFDYDRDGRLDLFVVNYVDWDPAREPACGSQGGKIRTYCHPKVYAPLANRLYHNEGGGRFRDVSAESGIGAHQGKGMGVAFADYDDDGDTDVFVTNDTLPNFLFRNEGNGRFTEVGTDAGVALTDDGQPVSAMGVDVRDIDNDGRPDVFVTALVNETFPLFRNLGRGLFEDATLRSGLGKATLLTSGWGAAIADLDNDGWKDLLAAGGDVQDNTELYSERKSRQASLVIRNRGGLRFAAQPLGPPALYRGLAVGDLNGDGRLDAVLTRINDRAVVVRNESTVRHWLRVRLTGTRSNRDGLGARVRIELADGTRQWNEVTTAVGYASASEPVAHFGLGAQTLVREVEVRWPSGVVQRLTDVRADQLLAVREPSAAAPGPGRGAGRAAGVAGGQ